MTHRFLGLAFLLFFSLLVLGVTWLIKKNPEIVAGYKHSCDPIRRKKGEIKIERLAKSLRTSAIVTFVCGILALLIASKLLFTLSFLLPLIVGIILVNKTKRQ